jgi:hypothetical protein
MKSINPDVIPCTWSGCECRQFEIASELPKTPNNPKISNCDGCGKEANELHGVGYNSTQFLCKDCLNTHSSSVTMATLSKEPERQLGITLESMKEDRINKSKELKNIAIEILSSYVDKITNNCDKLSSEFSTELKRLNAESYKWAIEEIKKKFLEVKE